MGKQSSWCGTDDHKHKMRYNDGPARVEIWKAEKKIRLFLGIRVAWIHRFMTCNWRSCVDLLSFPPIVHDPSQGSLFRYRQDVRPGPSEQLIRACAFLWQGTFLKTETSDSGATTDQTKIGDPDICHEIHQIGVTRTLFKTNNAYCISFEYFYICRLCSGSILVGCLWPLRTVDRGILNASTDVDGPSGRHHKQKTQLNWVQW